MERALRLLAGMLVFAVSASAGAQRVEAPEASVKAAFLYKFAGYVEWPPRTGGGAAEPFTIGVLDSEAVAEELERLVPGRSIAGRPAVVRRLHRGDSVKGVQLLFAGGPAPDPDAIRAAQAQGALVVTESRSGLAAGSAINFVMAGDHVGFEVSLEGAERSGLRISSRMLAVARRVVQKGA
ncbi:MAG TPA: YfiR family protein [Usitatibacter sp.]|nr:YfiR family protein [Usitatibacter sp.]